MANLDLTKYGITGTVEIVHNPSYDVLFAEETKAGLEGFEKGQVTELGAVNVMTGIYTGRSPKDKFLVKDATSENTVWWTSEEYKNDNKPVTTETWNVLKELAAKELSNKKLFVVDGYCGEFCSAYYDYFREYVSKKSAEKTELGFRIQDEVFSEEPGDVGFFTKSHRQVLEDFGTRSSSDIKCDARDYKRLRYRYDWKSCRCDRNCSMFIYDWSNSCSFVEA